LEDNVFIYDHSNNKLNKATRNILYITIFGVWCLNLSCVR